MSTNTEYTINGFDIVNRIDNCLKAMKLTRQEAATVIGKNKQVFTDWRNAGVIPRVDDMYKLAKFLGVPIDYLVLGEKIMSDEVAAIASKLLTLNDKQRGSVITMLDGQIEYWNKQGSENNDD